MEVNDGMLVNLGIGVPTLIANYVSTDLDDVQFHAENGMVGLGPFP